MIEIRKTDKARKPMGKKVSAKYGVFKDGKRVGTIYNAQANLIQPSWTIIDLHRDEEVARYLDTLAVAKQWAHIYFGEGA